MKISALGLGCVLVLSACASPRGPEVTCQGGLGGAVPRSYAMTRIGDAPERAQIEAAIVRQLTADGFAASDQPGYLVEVLYGERPAKVGAYEKLAQEGAPDWRVAPVKTPWWGPRKPTIAKMSVRFIDAKTGAEVYRANASGRSDLDKTAADAAARFDGLARAALSAPACLPGKT